jgi:hypothetical protein
MLFTLEVGIELGVSGPIDNTEYTAIQNGSMMGLDLNIAMRWSLEISMKRNGQDKEKSGWRKRRNYLYSTCH